MDFLIQSHREIISGELILIIYGPGAIEPQELRWIQSKISDDVLPFADLPE